MTSDSVSSMLRSCGSSLENVTRLTLDSVSVRSSTLAMFVSNFPRLDELSISAFPLQPMLSGAGYSYPRVDVVPTHPRGNFSVLGASMFKAPKDIFGGIALLKPRFRQVSFADVSCDAWRDYWPLLEACAGSLEELHILATATGE
jgi:hypothetical protein